MKVISETLRKHRPSVLCGFLSIWASTLEGKKAPGIWHPLSLAQYSTGPLYWVSRGYGFGITWWMGIAARFTTPRFSTNQTPTWCFQWEQWGVPGRLTRIIQNFWSRSWSPYKSSASLGSCLFSGYSIPGLRHNSPWAILWASPGLEVCHRDGSTWILTGSGPYGFGSVNR